MTSPSSLNHCVVMCSGLSIKPTIATVGVGSIGAGVGVGSAGAAVGVGVATSSAGIVGSGEGCGDDVSSLMAAAAMSGTTPELSAVATTSALKVLARARRSGEESMRDLFGESDRQTCLRPLYGFDVAQRLPDDCSRFTRFERMVNVPHGRLSSTPRAARRIGT